MNVGNVVNECGNVVNVENECDECGGMKVMNVAEYLSGRGEYLLPIAHSLQLQEDSLGYIQWLTIQTGGTSQWVCSSRCSQSKKADPSKWVIWLMG
jgi:hypothetical protein